MITIQENDDTITEDVFKNFVKKAIGIEAKPARQIFYDNIKLIADRTTEDAKRGISQSVIMSLHQDGSALVNVTYGVFTDDGEHLLPIVKASMVKLWKKFYVNLPLNEPKKAYSLFVTKSKREIIALNGVINKVLDIPTLLKMATSGRKRV